jgi:UDP-2-acetamido-2,6-beta-L-arabino-hexul-4-ose reductase
VRIVVTGSKGFIGKNLCLRLREKSVFDVLEINRETSSQQVSLFLSQADFVFHLGGINRPKGLDSFQNGNVNLTNFIIRTLEKHRRYVPIVFSSSTQIDQDNQYGKSKLAAEKELKDYSKRTGALHYIYRLPNVFGKWCKPNYNSFVATFCYNIMNGIELSIRDPNAEVTLVSIDDVCESFLRLLIDMPPLDRLKVTPEYKTTVGEVAKILTSFSTSRDDLMMEHVGTGLPRLLYSTFISYLPTDKFCYSISSHVDERGVFCEMLKTKDSGQFSFFTAYPGVTRGGHYHHTKIEKFLVIRGNARFCFRHILTNEEFSIDTSEKTPTIVETVPGWSHDITNNGDNDLVVMLWANEIFDHNKPDTIESKIKK